MQFVFKRNILHSIIQFYVPSALLVIISWLSFWISPDAIPARVTIGMMTVLTMTTHSTAANSQLPRVPYVKAIDIWMSACLIFVFASLLEFAAIHVFLRKGTRQNERYDITKSPAGQEDEIALDQVMVISPSSASKFHIFVSCMLAYKRHAMGKCSGFVAFSCHAGL